MTLEQWIICIQGAVLGSMTAVIVHLRRRR